MADPQAVGQTDVGLRRDRNEDSFGLFPPPDPDHPALYIVADGMGGHAGGEIASALAVDQIATAFANSAETNLQQRIAQAVRAANEAILEDSFTTAERRGMGTTIVCAVVQGARLIRAHVGDSRLYRIRDDEISRLTEDHSWVEEQLRAGLISADEARTSARRNLITRALGISIEVQVDLSEHAIVAGDRYLLCTDGLSNQVDDDEIRSIVTSLPPQQACEKLIELANERGGPDNITALVVRIGAVSESAGVERHTSGASSSKIGQVPHVHPVPEPTASPAPPEPAAATQEPPAPTPETVQETAPAPAASIVPPHHGLEPIDSRPVTKPGPTVSVTWMLTWVMIALLLIALIINYQSSIRALFGL